mmetsp:Transcript_32227/g.55134  ORF Transcript_32227/g.55134 Transcript_32227/m.55134 type:complete len:271 (+) Transcript_32227:1-813(+)
MQFSRVAAVLLGVCAPAAGFVAVAGHSRGANALGPRIVTAGPLMNSDLKQRETAGEIVAGVGEGRGLPSLSGINTLPLPLQGATIIGLLVAIAGASAVLAGPVFDSVRGSSLWNLSRPTWPLLGFIYLAAGVAHFTEADGFENITPPNGTWGWWATPFSPRVNVLWTGVVEVFGGAWMLLGFGAQLLGLPLPAELGPVLSDAALTLFLLTALVTPANLYALSHNAKFPLDVETPVVGHAIRLSFQPVLLAMFWEMAQPTLLDAKFNLGLL